MSRIMENNEYIQRFEYSTIVPYKDYCNLNEKSDYTGYNSDSIFDQFITSYPLPKYDSKKKLFYFTTKENDIKLKLKKVLKTPRNSFDTTDENQIKRHYGRAFSEITCFIVERSVKRKGDNITIKSYFSSRHRGFNCIYFKKLNKTLSITINTKTGDITCFDSSQTGKVKGTSVRKNSFTYIQTRLHNSHSFLQIGKYMKGIESNLKEKRISIFDDEEFTKQIKMFLGIKTFSENYCENHKKLVSDLIVYFVNKKQIKIPNGDYLNFITKFYPTQKYLKKNDNKLIASVLDLIGIKTKSTIKLLHDYRNVNLISLKWYCDIFGNNFTKYISSLNNEVFKWSSEEQNPFSLDEFNKFHILNNVNNPKIFYLKDIEKENLVRILNNDGHIVNFFSQHKLQEFHDHFNMIHKLREYIPDLYMKSRNHLEFSDEHRELSKMMSAIKKGWVVEYQYDEKTLKDIESPIECLYNENELHILYPHILKREEDYSEEGSFMHHCVASYSDKDKSMIISLRTKDGLDRVTIEYNIQSGRPLQKRHFCNKEAPSTFEDGIFLLDDKVLKHARWGTLNWKEKKKVPVTINGIEVIPEKTGPRRAEDLFNNDLFF